MTNHTVFGYSGKSLQKHNIYKKGIPQNTLSYPIVR